MTESEVSRDPNITVHAAELFERWSGYLDSARAELGADVPFERLIARVASDWAAHEPAELAFVPDEVVAAAHEWRHESTGTTLLDRVERGELVSVRRVSDGEVVYLSPERIAAMSDGERSEYESYDPLLARALRRHAIESGFIESETESL